jgi:hypothetical protein
MNAAVVVLVIGLLGLALTALLIVKEPDAKIRVAMAAGAIGGFVIALLLAAALGRGTLEVLATATLSGAVLALALIGQWRFFRSLFARHGGKL